ncbi:MAG: hypothetical protein JSU66_11420 [Deltaproteobacteria bacterium]|nr:MAG: hypothetical protein JSU66_11420 [Deltaproteobacteria bacterium]
MWAALTLLLACAGAAPPRGTLPVLTPADTDPAAGYERPRKLRASDLWPPEVVRGPHHRVLESVSTDGFLHIYAIDSDFGAFEAAGDLSLRLHVQDIRALAALRDVAESAAFRAARSRARTQPFVARWNLVTAPVEALVGMPPEAWREVLRIAGLSPGERSPDEVRVRRGVAAFEATKRRLARRLGVNPYSLNGVLQVELNRVAWVCAAGGLSLERLPSLAESSLAPQPEDVIPADRLARLYQFDSPEDLRRRNRIELAVMGLENAMIDAFLEHPAYSPRQQTGVVESLVAIEPARDRAAYVKVALRAATPADPVLYLMNALLLRAHHQHVAPVERIVEVGPRIAAAYTEERKLVVPAQVDYLLWTRPTERFVRRVAQADPAELEITAREIWLSGTASALARREIERLGIRVVERSFEQTFRRLAPAEDAPGG